MTGAEAGPARPGLKVLIVDDNPDDRALIRRALRKEFDALDLTEVGTAAGFRDALDADAMTVVITDYELRWGDGIDVLHQVRARWPACAVIMFTDSGDERVAARAMKDGLDDYVVKSASQAGRLPVVIRRALEQRSQRQRARAAEAQMQALFDRLPAGVYRVNRDDRVLYANQALAAIMGYDTVDDLIGTDISDVFIDAAATRGRRTQKGEGVVTSTVRLRRRDGRVIWVRDSGRLVTDVDGTPLYFEGVIQDVTEAHEAQLEARRQAGFVELLQAVTATANEYDTLADALAPALHLIREALGWPLAHVYRVEDGVAHPTEIWETDGSRPATEFRRQTADLEFEAGEGLPGRALAAATTVWMEELPANPDFVRAGEFATGIAVPVVLKGEVLAVLELFHTAPLPRDPALLRVLDKAGVQLGRVAERERAERKRQEMEAAAREAQRLDAVGRLAGGIAHDFNNLLTVIQSQAEFLFMDLPESGVGREEIEGIQMAAERAADLTAQLLAFSREQVLRPRVVALNEVVESMAQLLERIIGEDIAIVQELSRPLPPITVDPTQLEQVIINMAVNARHAMPDGGTLTITTGIEELTEADTPDLPAGRYVSFTMADTGHGMDAATKERIFEPFFTTKSKDQGTGLGLAMAHGVVQQSGGAIRVESEPGEGATFRLCFPPADQPAEEGGRTDDPDAGREATGRILLVEDESAVRHVIEKALVRSGFSVRAVADGETGLEALERGEAFDLLLTDLLLPGMNGAVLIRRARERIPDLPAVIMSGYTRGEIGENGNSLPVDVTFLEKPPSNTDLIRAIRTAITGR